MRLTFSPRLLRMDRAFGTSSAVFCFFRTVILDTGITTCITHMHKRLTLIYHSWSHRFSFKTATTFLIILICCLIQATLFFFVFFYCYETIKSNDSIRIWSIILCRSLFELSVPICFCFIRTVVSVKLVLDCSKTEEKVKSVSFSMDNEQSQAVKQASLFLNKSFKM